jgi:hypothetical protein
MYKMPVENEFHRFFSCDNFMIILLKPVVVTEDWYVATSQILVGDIKTSLGVLSWRNIG